MTTELLRPLTGPKTLDLRLYQTETIESLRVAARSGFQRIILCAPTGSGKCLGEGTGLRSSRQCIGLGCLGSPATSESFG